MGHSRRLITAVTVAHFVVGLWLATGTPAPLLSADDVAHLGLARTLAGEGSAPLPVQPPYGLLYPLLLAPGWLVGLDEGAMIGFARVVNAALGAALIPLLFVLLRRLGENSTGKALVGATAAASLPAAMAHSSIVWTETLLPVVTVLGLLALAAFQAGPTPARAMIVAVAAGAQVSSHPRMIVVAVVIVAAAAVTAVGRRRIGPAVAVLAGFAGLYVLSEWARRSAQEAAFGSTGLYDAGDLIDRRGLDQLPDMVVLGIGTVAYLLLATAALAAVGAIGLWRAGFVGRVSLAVVAATVAMAGWFLSGVPRADKWLHGRYVEAVAAPLVAMGVARLATVSPRRLLELGGAIAAAGVFAAWAGPGDNWARPRSPVMMLGVEPAGAPFGAVRFEPGAAASVAMAALVGLWLLARFRDRLLPAALAGILLVGALSNDRTLDDLYRASLAAEAEDLVDSALIDGEPSDDAPSDDAPSSVAIDPNVPATTWVAVAWRVGLDRVGVGDGAADRVGVTHVLVPSDAAGPVGSEPVGEITGGVLHRVG